MSRIHNFSAGPGALPLPVLEQVRDELVDFRGAGMSILEMSHRGGVYEQVHMQAMADIKTLLGAGADWKVVFMGGGARTQFALLPLNLGRGRRTAYLTTGAWSEYALTEAKKASDAIELWSSAGTKHDRVPAPGAYAPDPAAAYLHYTSNNTIFGTEYSRVPDAGGAPLVCDMSSNILSRPIDIDKFSLIYAGAQKNMGPAGVTVLIIRDELLARSPADLPEMFSFQKHAAQDSMLNTPPVFAIYIVGLVCRHVMQQGGVAAMDALAERKATALYAEIDRDGFYRGHAQRDSRSRMNVTFRTPSEDLDKQFVKAADASGLSGLKGHRSVGGLRASIYNAVPEAAVDALIAFMGEFRRKHG
jgi:phosphoserine aminotransferase